MFLAIRLLVVDASRTITPGYWTPPSIFGLNAKTGGYGIEDMLFSFFFGGIAAGLFELIFRQKVSKSSDKRLRKGHALLVAMIAGILFLLLVPVNAIYFFIFLQFFGATLVILQRKDLIWHSVAGGAILMILYGILFAIFRFLFPSFIGQYYHLDRTSHLFILGVPLEEYLYALSLGMMWAPLYEYEHRVRDKKQRWIKLRRVSLAAGGARR